MRNWLAHWLRRLATRLDGDLYVSRTGIYRGAIALVDALANQIHDAVAKEMVDGQDSGEPQGIVSDSAQLWRDQLLFGSAYMVNGRRVPPEDVVHNSRTGRFTVSKPNLEDAPRYRDHQGRACNCLPPSAVDAGVRHLPLCPLYRPGPKLPDPFRHGERPAG